MEQDEIIKIEDCIIIVRGQNVMLDRDLARLYGVETKILNKAVKRNEERFPKDFMFQLSTEECSRFQNGTLNEIYNSRPQIATLSLDSESDTYGDEQRSRSQFVTLNKGRGSNIKYAPYAFTENGIAMLSGVLRSPTAIAVNIQIMRAFNAMRQFLTSNAHVFQRIETIEHNQLEMQNHLRLTDVRIYTKSHDRFLCIDDTVYHIGASIKDLGKKLFAFSRLNDISITELLARIS